ncbi:FKBP-type peptidyl-prolyl cis-trans isomerase [Alcanivorax quisquiliarum]|uniref:Peptidyl-prolyl cis-trans isomerase n=1 Tax=Alcanivorax quisquiliarum TaxID=2933565 RepID=A0ABT0E9R4_9GAMM|nr:FKBP-type peptidyl-prolyl cis-trans isomerase [Alcanivorax quisquiliarum]MCK0538582.1 FKBP-type peptidyl-prolyl cis-trans isomerase [Alcanivorax quisquiliarum]
MRILYLATASLLVIGCSQHTATLDDLATDQQRASYAVGMQVGKQLAPQIEQAELDPALLMLAMQTILEGDESQLLLDDAMAAEATAAYQEALTRRFEAERAENIALNQAAGEALLASNRARAEVTTLPSGLQYERLAGEPNGRQPTLEDTVLAHFHGTLPDGTVIDSSLDREQPASIPLKRVMPGWQEALQLMSEGEKWRIVLPPELAYGDESAGQHILPHSTLIFEIELIEIRPQA